MSKNAEMQVDFFSIQFRIFDLYILTYRMYKFAFLRFCHVSNLLAVVFLLLNFSEGDVSSLYFIFIELQIKASDKKVNMKLITKRKSTHIRFLSFDFSTQENKVFKHYFKFAKKCF